MVDAKIETQKSVSLIHSLLREHIGDKFKAS